MFVDSEKRTQLLQYFDLIGQKVRVPDAMKQAFGKEPAKLDKFFRGGKVRSTSFKSPALDTLESPFLQYLQK